MLLIHSTILCFVRIHKISKNWKTEVFFFLNLSSESSQVVLVRIFPMSFVCLLLVWMEKHNLLYKRGPELSFIGDCGRNSPLNVLIHVCPVLAELRVDALVADSSLRCASILLGKCSLNLIEE